jgi:hypothetical protein
MFCSAFLGGDCDWAPKEQSHAASGMVLPLSAHSLCFGVRCLQGAYARPLQKQHLSESRLLFGRTSVF